MSILNDKAKIIHHWLQKHEAVIVLVTEMSDVFPIVPFRLNEAEVGKIGIFGLTCKKLEDNLGKIGAYKIKLDTDQRSKKELAHALRVIIGDNPSFSDITKDVLISAARRLEKGD
jgi:hypothetical protein